MNTFLDMLVAPLWTMAGSPVSAGDLLGFATGIVCVVLAARAHIWNFPVGLANSLVLGLVFFKTRLFGDMGLQVVFFLLGVQGWIEWLRLSPASESAPTPTRRMDHLAGIPAVVAAALLLRQILVLAGGAAPWPDAFITAASLWAQWLLNRKTVSCWAWWIAVDIVSIPLYWSRHLPLIAALYVVFLVLCVQGWTRWNALVEDPLFPVSEAA